MGLTYLDRTSPQGVRHKVCAPPRRSHRAAVCRAQHLCLGRFLGTQYGVARRALLGRIGYVESRKFAENLVYHVITRNNDDNLNLVKALRGKGRVMSPFLLPAAS